MQIYLAASWPQRKRMRDIADHLRAIGIGVTSNWINSDRPVGMGPDDISQDPTAAVVGGSRDLHDINMADRVAVFTDISSSTGGFHVEYGYAIGKGKPIDIIGPKLNVFYALEFIPGVRHFSNAIAWFDQLHKDRFDQLHKDKER